MSHKINILDVLQSLVVSHYQITGSVPSSPIVLVGGSSLAAHGVRESNEDVDIWCETPLSEASERAVSRLIGDRTVLPGFCIDSTQERDLWGQVAIGDIESDGAVIGAVEIEGAAHRVLVEVSLKDLVVCDLRKNLG